MKLSIVTPFYNNSEKQISTIVKSLAQQSDKDFEWIVVNDNSDTEKASFFKNQLETSNIKKYQFISSKNNNGAAQSRNLGLKKCTSDYVAFVDCDDYVDKDFTCTINKASSESHADIIFFDYSRCKKDSIKPQKTLANNDTSSHEIILANMTTNVCGKAIKREIIKNNHLTFSNRKRYEDWEFMAKTVLSSSTFSYIQQSLYYYVDNCESVVHKHQKDVYKYSHEAFTDIKNYGMLAPDILEYLFIREVLYVAIKEIFQSGNKSDWRIIADLEKEYPMWKKNKHKFSFPKNIMLYLYKKGMYGTLNLVMRHL